MGPQSEVSEIGPQPEVSEITAQSEVNEIGTQSEKISPPNWFDKKHEMVTDVVLTHHHGSCKIWMHIVRWWKNGCIAFPFLDNFALLYFWGSAVITSYQICTCNFHDHLFGKFLCSESKSIRITYIFLRNVQICVLWCIFCQGKFRRSVVYL